jgi:hypothetical protein
MDSADMDSADMDSADIDFMVLAIGFKEDSILSLVLSIHLLPPPLSAL